MPKSVFQYYKESGFTITSSTFIKSLASFSLASAACSAATQTALQRSWRRLLLDFSLISKKLEKRKRNRILSSASKAVWNFPSLHQHQYLLNSQFSWNLILWKTVQFYSSGIQCVDYLYHNFNNFFFITYMLFMAVST